MKKLHWYYKFLIIFIIFFSMFFLLTENMSKIVNTSAYKNYINYISIPFNFINKYNIFNYKHVLEENELLNKKNLTLKSNIKKQENIEEELTKLKELLKLDNLYTEYNNVYAKTITRNKLYWFNTIIIDKGKNMKIKEGDPVITTNGLIGTVKTVTNNTSTVKLITNNEKTEKISVGIIKNNEMKHGTIIEYNYPYLKVELTDSKKGIETGDVLITSGLGNLPKNLEIGIIEKIEKDKYDVTNILYVRPFQNMNDLNYLAVLTK